MTQMLELTEKFKNHDYIKGFHGKDKMQEQIM